jgi:hypothetical protein
MTLHVGDASPKKTVSIVPHMDNILILVAERISFSGIVLASKLVRLVMPD